MTDPLLQLADTMVSEYASGSDDLMRQHEEAMECFDCRDHLDAGMHAFRWLRRIDQTLRELDYRGIQSLDDDARARLGRMYQTWLRTCAEAEKWIARLEAKGRTPENLSTFRECCEEARDIAARQDWMNQARHSLLQRSDSEDW